MKRVLPVLLLLLAALSLAQTTDGSKSKIAARDLAKLRRLKMRFLVPTYVPSGYRIKKFEIEEPINRVLLSTTVTYVNPRTKGEFILQMCSDGIGDVFFTINDGDTVEGNGMLNYSSPAIGKGIVESYVKGKERQWHLNWVVLRSKPTFVSLIGYNMSAREGKRIVEGLRFLK